MQANCFDTQDITTKHLSTTFQASHPRLERMNPLYAKNPILAKYAVDYGTNSSFASEQELPELASTQQFQRSDFGHSPGSISSFQYGLTSKTIDLKQQLQLSSQFNHQQQREYMPMLNEALKTTTATIIQPQTSQCLQNIKQGHFQAPSFQDSALSWQQPQQQQQLSANYIYNEPQSSSANYGQSDIVNENIPQPIIQPQNVLPTNVPQTASAPSLVPLANMNLQQLQILAQLIVQQQQQQQQSQAFQEPPQPIQSYGMQQAHYARQSTDFQYMPRPLTENNYQQDFNVTSSSLDLQRGGNFYQIQPIPPHLSQSQMYIQNPDINYWDNTTCDNFQHQQIALPQQQPRRKSVQNTHHNQKDDSDVFSVDQSLPHIVDVQVPVSGMQQSDSKFTRKLVEKKQNAIKSNQKSDTQAIRPFDPSTGHKIVLEIFQPTTKYLINGQSRQSIFAKQRPSSTKGKSPDAVKMKNQNFENAAQTYKSPVKKSSLSNNNNQVVGKHLVSDKNRQPLSSINVNTESVTIRRTESSAAKQRSPVQSSASKYKCGIDSTAKKNNQQTTNSQQHVQQIKQSQSQERRHSQFLKRNSRQTYEPKVALRSLKDNQIVVGKKNQEKELNGDLTLESTAKKQQPIHHDFNDESFQFLEPAIIYSTTKTGAYNNFEGVEAIHLDNNQLPVNYQLLEQSPDPLPQQQLQQQSDSIQEFENLENKCTLEVEHVISAQNGTTTAEDCEGGEDSDEESCQLTARVNDQLSIHEFASPTHLNDYDHLEEKRMPSLQDEIQDLKKQHETQQILIEKIPSLHDEILALKQQHEAQQILIDNLRTQLFLGEEKSNMLDQLNQELNSQLESFSYKEVTQKSVQTEKCAYIGKQANKICQTSEQEFQNYQQTIEIEHLTPKIKQKSEITFESVNEFLMQTFKDDKIDKVLQKILNRNKPFEIQMHKQFQSVNNLVVDEKTHYDGRISRKFTDRTEVTFSSGVQRVQFLDGFQVIYFENGDIRQTYPCGKMVYHFQRAGITQTVMPDGEKVLLFQNNQLEKHKPNGSKEIYFSDGSKKFVNVDGSESSIYL